MFHHTRPILKSKRSRIHCAPFIQLYPVRGVITHHENKTQRAIEGVRLLGVASNFKAREVGARGFKDR